MYFLNLFPHININLIILISLSYSGIINRFILFLSPSFSVAAPALWQLKDSFLAIQKDARKKQGRERERATNRGTKERSVLRAYPDIMKANIARV